MKKNWKSVKNWQSYRHEYGVLLFWDTAYMGTGRAGSVCQWGGRARSCCRQTWSISYRPITLVGSSRMRAILTGRVCASLYCSFTPLSPADHIAQCQPLRRYALSCEFDPVVVLYLFLSFFSFTSFSKSFFIVLLPLIQFNVNFRDYLYMLTIWILYFHATDWSVWFSDLLLVTACAGRAGKKTLKQNGQDQFIVGQRRVGPGREV